MVDGDRIGHLDEEAPIAHVPGAHVEVVRVHESVK